MIDRWFLRILIGRKGYLIRDWRTRFQAFKDCYEGFHNRLINARKIRLDLIRITDASAFAAVNNQLPCHSIHFIQIYYSWSVMIGACHMDPTRLLHEKGSSKISILLMLFPFWHFWSSNNWWNCNFRKYLQKISWNAGPNKKSWKQSDFSLFH